MRWLVVAGVVCALGGCVAAVDFDAFDRGGASDGGTPDASLTTNGDAGSGEAGAPDPDAGTDAGPDAGNVIFADDFNRPDGKVANDWSQVTDDSYEIQNDILVLTAQGYQYNEAGMYQPAALAPRDMTVSVEFTPLGTPFNTAQIHVRATLSPSFQTYGAAVEDGTTVFAFRGNDTGVDSLDTANLTHGLKVGDRYRLTLTITGASPVKLAYMCEHWNGTSWTVLANSTTTDGTDGQLKDPGLFGISADGAPNMTYDNFLATAP